MLGKKRRRQMNEITIGPETAAKLNDRLNEAIELLGEMNELLHKSAGLYLGGGWEPSSPFQEKLYDLQIRYQKLIGGRQESK